MKVCPSCSTEFEDQLNFCRQDGTALKLKGAGRNCPSCGQEVANDSKFCRQCGAGLEITKVPQSHMDFKRMVLPTTTARQAEITGGSSLDVAEGQLRQGNYREAISTLDTIIKSNPEHQEARLLHLYASLKLYNIYGYEKQIESLRLLSELSEREREIVREIFLIRSEEAQKQRRKDEAREYERLATRVILGQSLVEPAPEKTLTKTQPRRAEREVLEFPRKVQNQFQSNQRVTAQRPETSGSYNRKDLRTKKKRSRLLASFVLVFGLAGILAAGMVAHYAKKQGMSVRDLFKPKTPELRQTTGTVGSAPTSPVGQVLAAEELGFKVWGAAAVDPNRQESVISERIGSQLGNLRQLYQQEVQNKAQLMGTIILQLTISPTGGVTKVEEYAARIRDDEFKKMVINEAYKWIFPEASSGLVKVNYPLLFVPPGMDVASLAKWEQVVGPAERKPEEPVGTTEFVEKTKPSERVARPSGDRGRLSEPAPTQDPTPRTATRVEPTQPSPKPELERQRETKVVERKVIGPYEVLYPTSVYSEPRDDAQRVAQVEAGTKVNVVSVQGDWLEVRSKHGRPPGFIRKDSAVPSTTPLGVPQQPQTIAKERPILGPYQVIRPTLVYSAPREDSQRVARIASGRKVEVVDIHGEWLEILSNRGRLFIRKDSAVPLRSR